ncbi:MAG: GMC family oxidoreductase [Candidatus Dadabacteria bacterium]|nr:MAG: GMC family oxidoreductase [Candidatus Dadabacteria bacterium]
MPGWSRLAHGAPPVRKAPSPSHSRPMACLDGAKLTRNHRVRCDVVIVGTGAGGAVFAAEAAKAGLDVVMLEEGGYYTGKDLSGDAKFSFDHLYRDGGLTATLGRPPIPVPVGCCVGGTTMVNSGTCYRTPDFVLQRWEREFGLEGATELDNDYAAIEQDLSIKPVPDALYGPQHQRVEDAIKELGWAGSRIPRNEDGCISTGTCAMGCPSDGKTSMAVSKVPEALAAGATLWTRAPVRRILRHRNQVVGVAARAGTPEQPTDLLVTAETTVIACGALHTPALLLASGIGGPWIGRNLHLHPATRVVARFPDEIRGWQEVPQAYNIDEFIDDGVFIQGQFVPPDVQAPVIPGWGVEHRQRMAAFPRLASFGALISDRSAGRVRPAGRSTRPVATYRLQPADRDRLIFGIARTIEAFLAAGAEEVYSGVAAMPVVRSRTELARFERLQPPATQIEIMAFHPMGTVRAGGPEIAASDPWGRLYDVEGIVVSDGSLLPTSNRINPQLTIMALARRAARKLVAP